MASEQLNTLMLRIWCVAVQQADKLPNLLIFSVPPVIAVIVSRQNQRVVTIRLEEEACRRYMVVVLHVNGTELKTADVAER